MPQQHGTYEEIDGRPALRFERRLNHPIEAVWSAVTEPDELAQWFPARPEFDLRVGGAVEVADMPGMGGEVLEVDPPRRFAFTWGDDELRFELEPDGGATLLRFTHLMDERDRAARDLAGWHVCLGRLETLLAAGRAEAPGPEVTPEWSALYEEYVDRGMPSGAEIPS